jgi:hypothetical protein
VICVAKRCGEFDLQCAGALYLFARTEIWDPEVPPMPEDGDVQFSKADPTGALERQLGIYPYVMSGLSVMAYVDG